MSMKWWFATRKDVDTQVWRLERLLLAALNRLGFDIQDGQVVRDRIPSFAGSTLRDEFHRFGEKQDLLSGAVDVVLADLGYTKATDGTLDDATRQCQLANGTIYGALVRAQHDIANLAVASDRMRYTQNVTDESVAELTASVASQGRQLESRVTANDRAIEHLTRRIVSLEDRQAAKPKPARKPMRPAKKAARR